MLNISVIIPVYNAERFLEKAVDSALRFSEVKEILLIEDCSTDNSLETCKKIIQKDERLKLFQHYDKGNHGAGASRNLGLEKATQDFIAFLDADDYYLPNRFDAEKILFSNPEIEGVFGAIGVAFLSEKGEIEYGNKFKENKLTTVNYEASGKEIFEGLTGFKENFGLFFHLNTLTIKASSIREKNLKFNPFLRVHQDSDFNIKLSYHCHLHTGIIDRAIAIRGVHDNNRITKIKQYSGSFYKNMSKLYTSVYNWSKDQQEMDPKIAKVIKLRYTSFRIANKRGLAKKIFYLLSCIKNPELLKTRYRFHALNKHYD